MKFKSILTLISGIVVGGLAGATVGLLAAPRPGQQTRKLIKDNVDENLAKISSTVEEAQRQVASRVDQVTRETSKRSRRLQRIGQRMVSEQKASLERGLNRAKKAITV
jgi:gas vesicle protein